MTNRCHDIGRNDPCPCGSGKKYKKCCLPRDEQIAREILSADLLETGTLLDDYALLFRTIVVYGQGQMNYGPYAEVLQSEYERFEKHFQPGLYSDISDGLFLTWFYLDYRHGKDQKTLGERFIEEGFPRKLVDPGPRLVRDVVESYCTFYEILEVREEDLVLLEISTGRRWRAWRNGEALEQNPQVGELWYTRLVGTPEEAWFFMAPYVYPQEAGPWISRTLEDHKRNFSRYCGVPPENFTQKEFRDMAKASVQFWAGVFSNNPLPPRQAEIAAQLPELVNTDNEPLLFSKIFFTILNREALEKKLGSLSGIEFLPENRMWMWSRKEKRRGKILSATVLGTLRIENDRLVAETNSLERALKLKSKLIKSCKQWLAYEKIESRDFLSLLPLTKAEQEKFDREQEARKKDPVIRKFMKQQAEDYYYREWVHTKIPALGNKTPLQAAKSDRGRAQLEALLAKFEENQKRQDPDDPFRFDIGELRRILGLA